MQFPNLTRLRGLIPSLIIVSCGFILVVFPFMKNVGATSLPILLKPLGGADATPRWGHSMAYDLAQGKIVLFGGYNYSDTLGDTWIFDPEKKEWCNAYPAGKPGARGGHTMIYDPSLRKFILFGGIGESGFLGDTWFYDLVTNEWSNISNTGGPGARSGNALANDPTGGKVVLFGGYDGSNYLGDTWVYDSVANLWVNVTLGVGPGARCNPVLAYDSINRKFMLFGGTYGAELLGDTWIYDADANVWTNVTPTVGPGARWNHALVYDLTNKKMVLFGGASNGGYLGDTWWYDITTNFWINATPTVGPAARQSFTLAYDPIKSKIVLFGGRNDINFFGDTWFYDALTNQWTDETHWVYNWGLFWSLLIPCLTFTVVVLICVKFVRDEKKNKYRMEKKSDQLSCNWLQNSKAIHPCDHSKTPERGVKHRYLFMSKIQLQKNKSNLFLHALMFSMLFFYTLPAQLITFPLAYIIKTQLDLILNMQLELIPAGSGIWLGISSIVLTKECTGLFFAGFSLAYFLALNIPWAPKLKSLATFLALNFGINLLRILSTILINIWTHVDYDIIHTSFATLYILSMIFCLRGFDRKLMGDS